MKCNNSLCDANDIEKDDYFCYKCGSPTSIGHAYLNDKDNVKKIASGEILKQDHRFKVLIVFFTIILIIFILLSFIRGNSVFKPIFYFKRQFDTYIYGYKTSIIKTDNIYEKVNINSIQDANDFIIKDFSNQTWKCEYNLDILKIQNQIEEDYGIVNVNFCDMSYSEALEIKKVIDKIYGIFPNIKGYLTNITITNAKTNSEYVAYFQPMYQFVNNNLNIENYNKVNKTQILLNSYYYLNDNILNKNLDEIINNNLYVKDSTVNSLISHEIGHYITFVLYLKENNIDNIKYVTKDNENIINKLIEEYDNGIYTDKLLNLAINNYNNKYKKNLDINSFSNSISKYAGLVYENNKINSSEVIAEAVHDYYLHGNNANKCSLEIINIIKENM